jgi:TatD DNase family protein
MIGLIDSHSHLDAAEFDADRVQVLARARAAGVKCQIVPAVARSNFEKLRTLCTQGSGLFPAYGLHPMFLAEHREHHLDDLATWIQREKPVAVGECGLDFHIEGLDADTQRDFFRRQLELARDAGLPVIVHARRAVDEVIASIRRVGRLTGVVHSFSGSQEQAQQLWKLGFCLGIGGPVTYERARRLREIVANMPTEYLLLETDSPDQPLHGRQGERNEPAYLEQVCACIAELRGVPAQALAYATTQNCVRLFRLPEDTSDERIDAHRVTA